MSCVTEIVGCCSTEGHIWSDGFMVYSFMVSSSAADDSIKGTPSCMAIQQVLVVSGNILLVNVCLRRRKSDFWEGYASDSCWVSVSLSLDISLTLRKSHLETNLTN